MTDERIAADMDALVESAARAVYTQGGGIFWDGEDEWQDRSRETARAALLAVDLPALLERVEAAEREVARLLTSREVLIGQRDDFAERVARVEAVRLRLNGDPEYRITQAHAGHLIRAALTEGTEG